MDQREVLVVGAGFGGLEFAKRFSHPSCSVTILDRTNHHLFQPLLYQVAMAGLAAPDIAQPIRSILSRKPRLRVLLDQACSVDFASRTVKGEYSTLKYDYLVLAPGSVTSYFGNDHWKKFAPGLKTLEDALVIRRNVLLAFERAENEPDPARQSILTTIVIVGGGPTGVELAGACAELARRVLRRDFDNVDPAKAKVILIQSGEHVLNQFAPALSVKAEEQLRNLGVIVRTNSRVKDIEPEKITLESGEVIHAATMVWAAGVQAHPITRTCGAELDRAGRILVEPDLRVPGHPEVFVVGDAAAILQPGGTPVPGVAPAALQMGRHVAKLLQDEMNFPESPIPRAPFRYKDKGSLATIGRSAGIAQFGRVRFSGFPAWLAWLLVHLLFLIGLRNKVSVFFSWIYSYLTYKLGARIVVKGDQ
jgi:NADH dehydrogenase